MNKKAIILVIGAILIIASIIQEGIGLLSHTVDHVYKDLTLELIPHLFLLGIVLIIYWIYSVVKTKS